MKIITAPEEIPSHSEYEVKVFLAGGITGCVNWQSEIINKLGARFLNEDRLTILNPRRDNFDVKDSSIEKEQIEWEFNALHSAQLIFFYFPHETLCPITLYELGYWIRGNTPLVICTHPWYARKNDVQIQSALGNKNQEVEASLEFGFEKLLFTLRNQYGV